MSESIRKTIFDNLKKYLGTLSFWKNMESELLGYCTKLAEPDDEKTKIELITQLIEIKSYLLTQKLDESDIIFLSEFIEKLDNTKQISLYDEKKDQIEQKTLDKYATAGMGQEGVIAIKQNFNYEQLKVLTNYVYKKTGHIKFYISNEKVFHGQIIAEIFEFEQNIPIATLVKTKIKSENEKLDVQVKKILLFGEKINKQKYDVVKSIELPFFIYKFVNDRQQEFMLLSSNKLGVGDYVVSGVMTYCDDIKMITDSAKIMTKLPFLFCQSARARIVKFKNHEELSQMIISQKINSPKFFDYLFSIKINGSTKKLNHPVWFKFLIWGWFLHKGKGSFNNYPLHLFWCAEKNSGKSLMLNCLYARSDENKKIFSGSSSTLKHLIPSFKYNPARMGYLAESNRFSFCDEFLRCVMNVRTNQDGMTRDDSLTLMNDLLEHQKREAGSGVSNIMVNMTSRIIATTNPVYGTSNVNDLLNRIDESFMSRWLIYYQTPEHLKMIRDSNDEDLECYDLEIDMNDWLSIVDYLHSFSSKYDFKRLLTIYELVKPILNEGLRKHYDARHKHHIECLMDGIIKIRCLIENDMSFSARDVDYDVLNGVWKNVIKSWMDNVPIKNLPVDERVWFIPENCQIMYWHIYNCKKNVSRLDTEDFALNNLKLDKWKYRELMLILVDNGLLLEVNGGFETHKKY
jgi:hypothetical protein